VLDYYLPASGRQAARTGAPAGKRTGKPAQPAPALGEPTEPAEPAPAPEEDETDD